MIKIIKIAIQEGKLRYLVENFLPTVMNVGILRIADKEHGDYLEKYTPVHDKTVVFISEHSISRLKCLDGGRESKKDLNLLKELICY